jgi:ribonuclease HI
MGVAAARVTVGHAGAMARVRPPVAPLQPGETLVFTDGACLGNPGPGGWAWAVPDGPFASGRGWRNSAGKPVANRDLWEPLLALALTDDRPVRFDWVKGHSGNVMNDHVDMLANQAATTQTGVSGSHFT